jgi:hypothetical protein
LRWLVLFSSAFWAISGAVMNQFDEQHYSNDEDCVDFLSCLLSDGSVIVRFLGFTPLSNSYLALGFLTACFAVLVLLEHAVLRYQ